MSPGRHGRDVGRSVEAFGFWGDVLNAPFAAFGTSDRAAPDARLFVVSNKQFAHTAMDVAEHSVAVRRGAGRGGKGHRGGAVWHILGAMTDSAMCLLVAILTPSWQIISPSAARPHPPLTQHRPCCARCAPVPVPGAQPSSRLRHPASPAAPLPVVTEVAAVMHPRLCFAPRRTGRARRGGPQTRRGWQRRWAGSSWGAATPAGLVARTR